MNKKVTLLIALIVGLALVACVALAVIDGPALAELILRLHPIPPH
jgi:hypothetical protein